MNPRAIDNGEPISINLHWQIMDELGMTGAKTLMVGDTEYDMQMAQNAGTSALAVRYGVHEWGRLLAQRSLDCLETLPALQFWFERMEAI